MPNDRKDLYNISSTYLRIALVVKKVETSYKGLSPIKILEVKDLKMRQEAYGRSWKQYGIEKENII